MNMSATKRFMQHGYLADLCATLNANIDIISVVFGIWNIAITGILTIHWHGPLRLRQMYLILVSVLVALVFYKYMPDWTSWFVLAVICAWDLFAVLAPFGPLRILVKTAQERNEQLFPSLVYSSTCMYTIMTKTNDNEARTDDPGFVENGIPEEQNASSIPSRYTPFEQGVKLGLGDFIFYSVLISKASHETNWSTTLVCISSILFGLILTMILLALFQKTLPALPISITLGIITYFTTTYAIEPFVTHILIEQMIQI
ncbi:hypothetical protein ACOME3_000156 [Neoechinorhynchus agilis]